MAALMVAHLVSPKAAQMVACLVRTSGCNSAAVRVEPTATLSANLMAVHWESSSVGARAVTMEMMTAALKVDSTAASTENDWAERWVHSRDWTTAA